jgi:hypothetical protein
MMLAGLVCSAKLAIATPLATAVAQASSDRSATQGRASPGKPPAPAAAPQVWDSGAFVAANAGGTLQTLAAQDHLPLWSLTQLNQMPENAPLIVGQRVVIPRHLVPLTIASKPVTSGR